MQETTCGSGTVIYSVRYTTAADVKQQDMFCYWRADCVARAAVGCTQQLPDHCGHI